VDMNDDSFVSVSLVDDIQPSNSGQQLLLPRGFIHDLVEDQQVRADNERPTANDPVVFFSQGMNGMTMYRGTLGDQPSDAKLLKDGVKGWAAIAGRAVAKRLRGLTVMAALKSVNAGGKVESEFMPEHLASRILEKPNNVFSGGDLLWLTAWHLQQTGTAYWQKLRDGLGWCQELWPLPPGSTFPVFDAHEVVSGYVVVDGDGHEHPLPREDVIRFWDPDPATLYSGMGVLGPQALEYDTSRYMEQHFNRHWQNDATPRTVITAKPGTRKPSSGAKRAFYRRWRNDFDGRAGAFTGVPAFLPSGFDITELSPHGGVETSKELRDSSRDQTLMAYGVSRATLGDIIDVNRSAADTTDYVFDKHTMMPMTNQIAHTLTRDFTSEYDAMLIARFDDYLAPDKEFDLKREAQDLTNAVRTVQQVREDRGDNPADAPWGSLPIMQLGLGPYDGTAQEDLSFDDDEGSRGSYTLRDDDDEESLEYVDPEDAKAAWYRGIKFEQRFVGRMGRAVSDVLNAQRIRIIEEWTNNPIRNQGAALRGKRLTQKEVEKLLFSRKTWDKVLYDKLLPEVQRSFIVSAQEALDQVISGEVGVEVSSALIERITERHTIKLVGEINKRTLRKLTKIIGDSVISGDSISKTAREISKMKSFGRVRARRIARTETRSVMQNAQIRGWAASGEVSGKRWNDANDEQVRDSHDIGGQEQPLDNDFVLDDNERCIAPLDPTLSAKNRMNCRCFMTPIIKGE